MTLKKLLNLFLGLFPSKVPVGLSEFNGWSQSIMDTYALPTTDSDSIKYTLATIIMHLGPQAAYKSKLFFVLTLKAAAAKQVASSVFYEIKQAQQQKVAAAQASAPTALESSDGPKL